MKFTRLIFRSLLYHWRTNIPVIAGVATAVAVLSGALLVGQSVRGSLRSLLFERIGNTDTVVTADRLFAQDLADVFSSDMRSCSMLYLKGVVVHEGSGIRVHDVNVYGIDERFWSFQGIEQQKFTDDRAAWVGSGLAQAIEAKVGDDLLLQVETQESAPREWLYGKRDSVGRTIRLKCREILPANKMGEFSLRPNQGSVYSIFVPIQRLQKDLGQPSRANTILLAKPPKAIGPDSIRELLRQKLNLQDLSLKLRPLPPGAGFSLESSRIVLEDSIVQAAIQAASEMGMEISPVYTYLANSIRSNGRSIPYSVMTAADLGKGAMTSIYDTNGLPLPPNAMNGNASIWLTDWAWRELKSSPGDTIEVDYYIWLEAGKLETRTAQFTMAGIISTRGDVNATLAPEIPGITEARSMSAWDPPFPLDLNRIRSQDEEYWNRHKATPKAFVSLSHGQELWKNRFGNLTSLRFSPAKTTDTAYSQTKFAAALLNHLDPERAGFAIKALRNQGLAASRGSTDFAEYFIYFSTFLIAAAILLSVLFFRLMIEQRVREIGILRVAGFSIGLLLRIFFCEGLCLSFAGSFVGMTGAIAYGWFMVFGLRTWWVGAVGTQRIFLHIAWTDLALGAAIGILLSLATIAWTLQGLRRHTPRLLLTGALESISLKARRARAFEILSVLAFLAAALLISGSLFGKVPQLEAFFGTGLLMLVSILCATGLYLRRSHRHPIHGCGWQAFVRLGIRNATHRPGRSLLCAALIASATFIIVSMEAFRSDSRNLSLEPQSGTGGYPLIAESVLPVLYDLNSSEGREASGIPEQFKQVQFVPFRERPGDDASCLNLYAPQEPRILGVPRAFGTAGRFSFQNSLASTREQKNNPWLLLESPLPDGAIPAIADANTIQYILHLTLGKDLTLRASNGNLVRLRLVAALKDSIFQGELLISESNFLRAFPDREGYRFFLMDMAPESVPAMIRPLKESLSGISVRIESSIERLSSYHRVENAYLSTFQSLGTLGLILGTLGLAIALLRNVLERRQELALLRAVGYRRWILSGIVLAENAVLLIWGLATGTVCALISIAPALYSRSESVPILMMGLILAVVFTAGMAASLLAVVAAFRSPLLAALRSE
jgi:putative ABC transport system permease protein